MRRLIPFAVFFAVLVAVGWYALRVRNEAHASVLPAAAPTRPPLAPVAYERKPMAVVNGRPAGMLPYVPAPRFDPHKTHAPGTYIPRGFSANFREQIVKDFGDAIDVRLGKDFPVEKRKQMAAVQNDFWDDHGPDVDLFRDGKMTQPEFAEKTHLSTVRFMDGMAKVLSDQEYLRLFDLPKDVDAFYQLYHSPQEQPGMPFQAEAPKAPNNSVLPQQAPSLSASPSMQPSAAGAGAAGATATASAQPTVDPTWVPPTPGLPKH